MMTRRPPNVPRVSALDEPDIDEVIERFRRQSESAAPRAPLYVELCRVVAGDVHLAEMLLHAPGPQRLPVLFLAAVHAAVLGDPSADLGAWYPNITAEPRPPTSDPAALAAALAGFCTDHRDGIVELISTRTTQTNEVGRTALLLPVFGLLDDEAGPVAHVDVGSSAGLALLWPEFSYRYTPGGTVGSSSIVTLECGTRGDVPVPARMPQPAFRVGLDRSPIDATDDDQARWLEACVWPDQHDRFANLRAALEIARRQPPVVLQGDAVADTPSLVATASNSGHPVVTNTWVLVYLTAAERVAYVSALDRLGTELDFTWVFIEAPVGVPELPVDDVLGDPVQRERSVLTVVRWRDGVRSVDHVATCHPHGYWMHWNR
jgi:hypothetical protein